MRLYLSFLVTLVCMASSPAHAHGINGHLNVTDWSRSAANSPAVWSEPECQNALVFGSCFPDTGYAIDHPYGEILHWPPFLMALLDAFRSARAEQDLSTKCFVMGLAAHGLQDEIFDTFFLPQVRHYDLVDQDVIDPGLDAILVASRVADAKPSVFIPHELIIEVLRDEFAVNVSERELDEASRRVKIAVIDHFEAIAQSAAPQAREQMPWASTHYLDQGSVGSLMSEVEPTALYLQAVWQRLDGSKPGHDIISNFGGHLFFPEGPNGPSYVGLVLSRGVRVGSLATGIRVRVAEGDGADFSLIPVRAGIWTQGEADYTRVVWLAAPQDSDLSLLAFSAAPEWEWIDGSPSSDGWFNGIEAVDGFEDDVPDAASESLDESEPTNAALDDDSPQSADARARRSGCWVSWGGNAGSLGEILVFLLFVCGFERRNRSPSTRVKT